MDLIGFLIIGVIFNLVSIILSRKSHLHVRGIDSMPSIPIAAGFALGAGSGLATGIVLSITYHVMRPSTMGSLPLTFIGSAVAGVLGAIFSSMDFLAASMLILIIYHVISFTLIALMSQPSPGYITFIAVNVITTMLLLFVIGHVI